jgi:uncharacterized repeat protein (TIGR03803 family)
MAKLQGWRIGFVVFMLFAATVIAAPAQTFKTLASFDGTDGYNPVAGLVQGRDGNFYGTTTVGGATYSGTVFKITPAGTLTSLYTFCTVRGCPDGALANSLVLATDGNFYGTTQRGGSGTGKGCSGCGTVFKITPSGTLTTLHSFNFSDGFQPNGLIQATDGNLYGTAQYGGIKNHGTIFKISRAGNFKMWNLWPNGNGPTELIQGTDGSFYGVTYGLAGSSGDIYGLVFKMTALGKFTTLHKFIGSDGFHPNGLVQATDGNFYGTTLAGGSSQQQHCVGINAVCGTFFQMTPTGTLATLYNFCSQPGCSDGAGPGGVIQATDGNFYGTTFEGAIDGTVFEITSGGALTALYNFCKGPACADGAKPEGVLLQATNGTFYGTTQIGGFYDYGAVFSLSMGFGPFAAFVRSSGKAGAVVEILSQGLTGTTGVSFNGTAANFVVHSDTYLTATVPQGATTGYVTVTTPGGTLQSNVVFRVTQ